MKVVDGTYDFSRGAITAFRALGRDDLEHMRSVLERGRAGQLDADAAAAQAAAISPDVAALIAAVRAQSGWGSKDVVMALLTALSVVLAWMALHQRTTLTESDHEALRHDIGTAVERVVPPSQPPLNIRQPLAESTAQQIHPKRRKRPPKTFGRRKQRKR